ncbi:hypothetical protein AgCh_017226 [Apium graveolens]
MTPPDAKREDYFKTYGEACYYGKDSAKNPDKVLNDKLRDLEYIKNPNFNEDWFSFVRYAFQIPEDYEIKKQKKGERKALGGCLVEVPSSNKGWHKESLMFRGEDLGYFPEYHNLDGITWGIFKINRLEESEKEMAKTFAGGKLKGLWTANHFRKPDFYITTIQKKALRDPKSQIKEGSVTTPDIGQSGTLQVSTVVKKISGESHKRKIPTEGTRLSVLKESEEILEPKQQKLVCGDSDIEVYVLQENIQFGTRFLDVVKRVELKEFQLAEERKKTFQEKSTKDEILDLMRIAR